MMSNIIIGKEPTRRELINCAMVGCVLYLDDLEIGEITFVIDGDECFGGHVELE